MTTRSRPARPRSTPRAGRSTASGRTTTCPACKLDFGDPGAPPPNPPAPTAPPGGGASPPRPSPPPAAPPAPPPAAGPVGKQDLEDIRLFIDTASLAGNRMPTPDTVYGALVQAGSPAAAQVKNGAIVLTGARTREGVWAYEARALQNGGLVVTNNGVETMTAAELRQRLGR